MEVSIFSTAEVSAVKSKFVEARLHADTKDLVLRKRIAELVETVARSTAQPIYVAMKPSTEVELGRFNGVSLAGPAPFVLFLESMAGEL